MKPVLLLLVLAAAAAPLLAGCRPDPTPAKPLSPEEERKYEERLRRKAAEEGAAQTRQN